MINRIKASAVLALPVTALVSARCTDDNDGALDHRAAWDAIYAAARTGVRPSAYLGGLSTVRVRWAGADEHLVIAG